MSLKTTQLFLYQFIQFCSYLIIFSLTSRYLFKQSCHCQFYLEFQNLLRTHWVHITLYNFLAQLLIHSYYKTIIKFIKGQFIIKAISATSHSFLLQNYPSKVNLLSKFLSIHFMISWISLWEIGILVETKKLFRSDTVK